MTATECEHGDPRPGRCALCRQRERERIEPWHAPLTAPTRTAPTPRPAWFAAAVEAAREAARQTSPTPTQDTLEGIEP